jgi:rhodanese-related sulfurtransferase
MPLWGILTMTRVLFLAFALVQLCAAPLWAADKAVRITPDDMSRSFSVSGKSYEIARNQDPDAVLSGEFAKTSRACPPFCIHPMSAGAGVETIGEIEVMDFLSSRVAQGQGLLIDSRVPEWFAKGTIPGSVNVPFATLEATNPYRDEILKALGAIQQGSAWDFSGAFDLALFCNGPWCDQSPRAIRNLLDVGYPAEKIKYYRGGMQDWMILGLTVLEP